MKNSKILFKNVVKGIKETLIIIFKVIICLLFTIIIALSSIAVPFLNKHLWQNILYTLYFIYILFGFWVLFLKHTKKVTKIIYIALFIFYLPLAKHSIDMDYYVDSGYCPQGLVIGGEKMTKGLCLKKNLKWNDKRKECDMIKDREKIRKLYNLSK